MAAWICNKARMFAFQRVTSKQRICKIRQLKSSMCKIETRPKNIIRIRQRARNIRILKDIFILREGTFYFWVRKEYFLFLVDFVRRYSAKNTILMFKCRNKIRIGKSACKVELILHDCTSRWYLFQFLSEKVLLSFSR